jgi:heme exporter protein B
MLSLIRAVIGRDLRLAMRRQADIVAAMFFFIIVVSLFPLGVGPEPDQLRRLAPGVLWVAALLATMLSLPRLFADDHRDGTLEQLALAPQPLALIVLGKVIAHCSSPACRWSCWRRCWESSSTWRAMRWRC